MLLMVISISGERDTFQECDFENFNNVFSTNVFGAMLTFQNLSPLVLRGSSRILANISSTMGSITKTGEGTCARCLIYSPPLVLEA